VLDRSLLEIETPRFRWKDLGPNTFPFFPRGPRRLCASAVNSNAKRFQVTSGQHSSPRACTALSTASESAGRFAPSLCDRRFFRLPLRRSGTRRVPLSDGTVRSRRRFARPRRPPLARIPLRGQRSSPGASFARDPVPAPVRPLGSATCRWFAPAAGRIHASDPLRSYRSARPAARPISTPPRGFSAPPDQSVRLVTRPSGPPSESARSSFAPRSRLFLISCGSSFPNRYVSGGLLFLKPLGTFFTMRSVTSTVNHRIASGRPFQQLLSRLFRTSYRIAAVDPLCIKRAPGVLFPAVIA
jgi:hypothetical protein